MTKRRKPVLILCVAAFAVAGATIAVVNAPSSGAATTLGAAAAEQGRVFGTAVAANLLADQRYTDILDTEFTGATPENEMKWDATEPSPGTFRFAAADLRANLERFADLGIEVQITELDVRRPTPPSEANLRTQADDYAEVVGACLAVSMQQRHRLADQ